MPANFHGTPKDETGAADPITISETTNVEIPEWAGKIVSMVLFDKSIHVACEFGVFKLTDSGPVVVMRLR